MWKISIVILQDTELTRQPEICTSTWSVHVKL